MDEKKLIQKSDEQLKINISQEKENIEIAFLLERLDFMDIIILKKFYLTGKAFPHDTQPYCFPILYGEMKENNNLKLTKEGLRKRLHSLVKVGLLEKINGSNPSIYLPIKNKVDFVRKLIKKFFLTSGLFNSLI